MGISETTVPQVSSVSLFSLNKDGAPCILLQVDASITFTYKTKSGEDRVSLILHIINQNYAYPPFIETQTEILNVYEEYMLLTGSHFF
jgi:hypothetical protein